MIYGREDRVEATFLWESDTLQCVQLLIPTKHGITHVAKTQFLKKDPQHRRKVMYFQNQGHQGQDTGFSSTGQWDFGQVT